MQNLLKNIFHILTLNLWVSLFLTFPQTTLAKKKDFKLLEIVREVKGLSGNASLLANRWINKQKDFVLVEFQPGKKGVYLTNGTLKGTSVDGKTAEILVPEDFKSNTPGMILDHLRALRSKLDSSEISRTELKEQIARNAKSKKDWAKQKLKIEKQIQKTINARIDEIFENELSSADRSIIASLEKELDSQLRSNIVDEIERETRKDLPNADLAELDREINKRVDKELNPRVAEEIHQLILSEKLGNNPYFADARKLIHRVITRNRPKIEAEVRFHFQAKERKQHIKLKNKILYGIIPPKEIDNSIMGKLKHLWAKIIPPKK